MSAVTTDDLAARVARLEAIEQIRQLASRYALALDARDLDALVALYVDDVRATGGRHGRDALREEFEQALSTFGVSIHVVATHVIDLEDDTLARGHVYCRCEHQVNGHWVVVTLLYEDAYERRGDRWYFRQRKLRTWYGTDILERPTGGLMRWPGRQDVESDLPERWPTWHEFWERVGQRPSV